MEEQIPHIPEEEPENTYLPRPRWQVWGARVGLVIMAIGIVLWLCNIAFPA